MAPAREHSSQNMKESAVLRQATYSNFINSPNIHEAQIQYKCLVYSLYILIDTLIHWCRLTHICVGNLTIISSNNGLSHRRHQAIIWTNAGILLIGPLGTKFSAILIGIQTWSLKKMHFKMSSAKWRPFILGLNVLRIHRYHYRMHIVFHLGERFHVTMSSTVFYMNKTTPSHGYQTKISDNTARILKAKIQQQQAALIV